MTEEKYLELRAAGVDQFSVSLDFPDERHDDFRKYPGLYARLAQLVPGLASLGHDDIVLNSCIHQRQSRGNQPAGRQSKRVGGKPLLQLLLGAPHRMP